MLENTITTSTAEKAILEEAADEIHAARILEIGAFHGKTTAVLRRAAARHDGYVVVIDPMKWASEPADLLERVGGWFQRDNFERHFWDNVRGGADDNVILIRALSTDPALVARHCLLLREFDLVFIDGGHTFPVVASDLANWGARVRPGGRILLHDALPRWEGVIRAIHQYEGQAGLEVRWPVAGSSVCSILVHEKLRPALKAPLRRLAVDA